jgi:hypothetical protein
VEDIVNNLDMAIFGAFFDLSVRPVMGIMDIAGDRRRGSAVPQPDRLSRFAQTAEDG